MLALAQGKAALDHRGRPALDQDKVVLDHKGHPALGLGKAALDHKEHAALAPPLGRLRVVLVQYMDKAISC